jgi:hypothetical protein
MEVRFLDRTSFVFGVSCHALFWLPQVSVPKAKEGTMSHTSRNFVVAYVLLVGLPLVGLAGVLRAGRTLVAPISVDGVWKIEVDASRLPGQPCANSVSSLSSTSVVISQSGRNLVLSFNNPVKTVASGELDGKSLKASIAPGKDPSSECGADQSVVLTASVDPKSEPRSLTGVLTVSGCPSCTPVEFHATRQPRSSAGGAH